MPIAYVFWLIMILWLVLGAYFRYDPAAPSPWRVWLPDLFPFLALCLLGYHAFGSALK